MLWVVVVISCIKFCNGQFKDLTDKILNWYEFSPKSLNVDSCLGLRWAEAFAPENGRLGRLVAECTGTVKQTEPRYWKRTQYVFNLHWRPLDSSQSRMMVKPGKKYTKTKFDEDFTDRCFSEIPTCRLSHVCVRYIFAPPGRRYFVTHQLLLSYAYRINCPENSLFWNDLEQNEKALCGSIHKEVWHRIELCDLRLEQVLLCGMAGFKGFLSQQWKKHLLDALDVFKVKNHQFACVKTKTSNKPVYPLRRLHKRKLRGPPKKAEPPEQVPAERSVSKITEKIVKLERSLEDVESRTRHEQIAKLKLKRSLQEAESRTHHHKRKHHRHRAGHHKQKHHRHETGRHQRKHHRKGKRRRHSHSDQGRHQRESLDSAANEPDDTDDQDDDSLYGSVFGDSPKQNPPLRRKHHVHQQMRVIQRRNIPTRVSAREKLRRIRKKERQRKRANADTLLDLSFRGRRNLHAKTDKFGCDSHTTALLIANLLIMK